MNIDKPGFQGNDYDFAVGSVKGLRSWNIDNKGRLLGVTHPAVWLPGENVATCKVRPRCPERAPGEYYGGVRFRYYDELASPSRKPCGFKGCDGTYHPAEHGFDAACECGFWAYDDAGFKPHGVVSGIIEGYGKTTIGTQGFRCEKARIVGLIRDDYEGGTLPLSTWMRLKQIYPGAAFYDELDDAVTAHGQVMRSWPAVGEDFWEDDKPERRELTYSAQLSALNSQLNALRAANTYAWPTKWHAGGIA